MNWERNGIILHDCAVFWKTREPLGGLSNMSNEYPLVVNGVRIGSSEALYQASRYPHRPDWQREIINARSPMESKMKAKKEGRRRLSRADWDRVRVRVMFYCLQVKMNQHFGRFFNLLRSTGDRAIVERSRRDKFWGAVPAGDDLLCGENMLGGLLVELRNEVVEWMKGDDEEAEWPEPVPPAIPNFLLLGRAMTCQELSVREL